MMKYTLLLSLLTGLAPTLAHSADVTTCGAGVYCNIPGEYRPALVFGAGQSGIRSVRNGVRQNQELIADILSYQLTTDPENLDTRTLGGRIISPRINKSYDLPVAPFREALPMPAIGYVLNPELYSSEEGSTTAHLNQISYPQRTVGGDTFKGVKIDNFSIKDVDIDLSRFGGSDNSQSIIKICSNIKLDLKTSLELNFKARDADYQVGVENIDLLIDSNKSEPVCFNATIDMTTFNVSSIERIGSKPLLQREDINKAFSNPGLKISVPSTTPLSQLEQGDLNRIAAGYLTPVLAEATVAKMIEDPVILNLRDVLKDQVNTVIAATLSNQNDRLPEINLPMFNIPNSFLTTTINEHLDGIQALSGNMKCGEFIDRIRNIEYWIKQNPGYREAATSARLSQFASSVNRNTHRCKNKDHFNSTLNSLTRLGPALSPSPQQTEQLLIRQLMNVGENGNLSVEIFIPELCEGNYTSALAGRNQPEGCDNFYSMLDLSYINNYLSDQISKGTLCGTNQNGKCGIRMMDNPDEYQGDERPKFSCDDMDSIGISALGGANMRATVSLRNCQAKGRRSAINLGLWRLGSFENTDIQMSYDVKLSRQCSNGKPVCFAVKFRDDLFSYQGELETASLEGRITDALKEEMALLEQQFNESLANFPIEDFTAGLEITNLFGGPATETSPGYLGACLKTAGDEGARSHVCMMATRLLPQNHPSLARYCQ
ncbi:MAG: hypothetical protein CME71_06785 [Halobacteriovorax sp.]|nr:hypothetical protein [Halobacteriovorax sp.]